jgi:hypothetical protein
LLLDLENGVFVLHSARAGVVRPSDLHVVMPPCGVEASWEILRQGQVVRARGGAAASLGKLTESYVPSKIWYLVVPLAGKLGVAAALALANPKTRAILGCSWCMLLTLLVSIVCPYRRLSDAYMEAAAFAVVAMVFAMPLVVGDLGPLKHAVDTAHAESTIRRTNCSYQAYGLWQPCFTITSLNFLN